MYGMTSTTAKRDPKNPAREGTMIRSRVSRGTVLGAALVVALAAAGCGRLGVWAAPAKTRRTANSRYSMKAPLYDIREGVRAPLY